MQTFAIASPYCDFCIDVDDIKYVVNFDYPSSSEDYVHRIGRTGRRDKKGTAYTFFTTNNAKQANELIDVLKEANQEISPKLFELASQSYRYGKNIRKRYGGYSGGGGGYGGNRFGASRNGFAAGGASSNGFGSSNGFKRKFDDSSADSKRFKPAGGYAGRPAPNYGSSSGASNGFSHDRFNSFA